MQAAVRVFAMMVIWPASLSAQVNPVNDFFGGLSVLSIDSDATGGRRTPIGWQVSVSQKTKSAVDAATKGDTRISIVGDFGGQFGALDNGGSLHVYEYMGGLRARAGSRTQRTSAFAHALIGGTTRSGDASSGTGFMMGYGGGLDMTTHPSGPAYDLGMRVQFDWLPSRVDAAWAARQFRIAAGLVFVVRYWD